MALLHDHAGHDAIGTLATRVARRRRRLASARRGRAIPVRELALKERLASPIDVEEQQALTGAVDQAARGLALEAELADRG